MVVIGLTGNIASGKSTVLRMLSELGAVIIDTDRIGHRVLEPYSRAWQETVQVFGKEILAPADEIDRYKLGRKVFTDPQALEKLNDITHPRIRRLAEKEIEKLSREGVEVVVLEVPLLIEVGWAQLVDQIWVTTASEATAVRRLTRRFGFSEGEAKARLRSQLPIEEKVKHADAVIDTDSEDLALVRAQVESAWHKLLMREPKEVDLKQRLKQALSQREKRGLAAPDLTQVGILIPIYEKEREYHILFLKRVKEVQYHEGRISFPGGTIASGESLLAATLQRSFKEIGLQARAVEVLGETDDERTLGDFVISPFVAFIPYPYEFRINREEVEELMPVPFSELLDPANFRVRRVEGQGLAYFYHTGGEVIGGSIARILNKLLNTIFGLE